jgi:hypothetical protein
MSVVLDGTNDYLNQQNGLDYNLAYTVIFWWKPGSVSVFQSIYSVAGGTDGENLDGVFLTSAGKIQIYMKQATTYEIDQTSAGAALSNGVWYCIALVRSGNNLTAYRGTESTAMAQEVTGASSPAGRTAATRQRFGAWPSDVAFDFGNGSLFAPRMFDGVSLTLAELIQNQFAITPQLYNATSWYPMWNAADATTDYSGNGDTWTVTGTLTDDANPAISYGGRALEQSFVAAAAGGGTGRADFYHRLMRTGVLHA